MLNKALESLISYKVGTDPKVLKPIDEEIVATQGDASARQKLEYRLAEVLNSDASRAAKDFVFRKLKIIGTTLSVPVIAEMLTKKEFSHMARYALESNPAPEAAQALRDALSQTSGELKAGVIGSLGVRQDMESVSTLAGLLGDTDATVARAAAHALGAIRSGDAAKALSNSRANGEAGAAVTDSSLACAEALLANGKNSDALLIYKKLAAQKQPKHVRLAATKGMLACAKKT